MRILLTGATGFNGKNLVGPIISKGHKLRCLVRRVSKEEDIDWIKKFNPEIVKGDILNLSSLYGVTKDIDIIIHMAGCIPDYKTRDKDVWDVNVIGTKNIVTLAKRERIKKIIFCSTISVYGEVDNIDESGKLCAKGIYETSKLEAEKIISNSGLNFTILRLGTIFGPFNRRLEKIVTLLKNNTFAVIGRGDNLVQPIYIKDFVKIISKEIKSTKGEGIVNIAGDKRITTFQFYNLVYKSIYNKEYHAFFRIPYPLAKFYLMTFSKPIAFLRIDPLITQQALDFQTQNRTYDITKLRDIYKIRFSDFNSSVLNFVKWHIDK